MANKQADWEAIERAYRAGALSIRTIADRDGVSDTAILKKAKALGWERDLSEQVRKEVRNKLVRGEVRDDQCANPERDAEIIDETAAEGAQVVCSHRRDIRKATNLANLLMDDLLQTIQKREEIEDAIIEDAAERPERSAPWLDARRSRPVYQRQAPSSVVLCPEEPAGAGAPGVQSG